MKRIEFWGQWFNLNHIAISENQVSSPIDAALFFSSKDTRADTSRKTEYKILMTSIYLISSIMISHSYLF